MYAKNKRQKEVYFWLFCWGDRVGAHLICGAPCAAIKFKIQGHVNEPASRRNRYSNVRRSHINIYGKFAGTRQRRGPGGATAAAAAASSSLQYVPLQYARLFHFAFLLQLQAFFIQLPPFNDGSSFLFNFACSINIFHSITFGNAF